MDVLLLALLTSAPVAPRAPDFVLPAERKGNVTATLTLRVPEQGPAPGRGRVQLSLHLHGPATLEVEGLRLEDALAGWRTTRAASSWMGSEQAADWEQTLELVQVKPGAVPLPGVTLRFRSGPSAAWEEIGWPELLNEPRDVPGPVELPPLPPSPWPGRLRLVGVVLAGAFGLALLVRVGQRWRAGGDRAVSAHERALARLGELPEEAIAAITDLDNVLRSYLEERFGVDALRRTNHEVLSALANKAEPSPEQITVLVELLGCFERAKFAGEAQGVALRDAAKRATAFVRSCALREESPDREGGKSGEKRSDTEGG